MLRKSGDGDGDGLKRDHAPAASRHHHSDSPAGSPSAVSAKTWGGGGGRGRRSHNLLSGSSDPSWVSASCPPGVDPEYVMTLVNDVRRFANVLLHLKEAFQCQEGQEGLQQVVQERLAELLRVLKAVIAKHPALNSVDILGKAGTLIAKVKGINFNNVRLDNRDGTFGEIHACIDTLAFTFGNVVSDFLMGDVDNGSGLGSPQTRRSRSFDNLAADPEDYAAEKNDLAGPDVPVSREEEVDLTLLKHDSGVESALLYAKAWSKYIKDLLAWMEKRVTMDMEYAKSYAKLAESARSLVTQQDYMPFSDIYNSTFKNNVENNNLLMQSALALQTNKFIQPLLARKNELDKLRKDLKEQWQRELKKMHEAETSLRKARGLKAQRREEYQKARSSTSRSLEEQPNAGNKQLERKRRLEEEALQKAEEAQDQYQCSMADAGVRRMDLANVKRTILTQIRETIFQCDLTLKAVTVNWFQMQHAQTASLPAHHQALSDSAKLYEPGECYSEFVRRLPRHLPRERVHSDSVSSDGARFVFTKRSVGSTHSSHGNLSQASLTSGDVLSGDEVDSPLHRRPGMATRRSDSSNDIPGLRGQHPPTRGWTSGSPGSQGGMCSDSESAGGSSESRSMDSPSASPGDFKRRLPRTPSTGTMSSADDLDEREPMSPLDNGLSEMVSASSPGPFRNTQMSKAAQTHKLRKLRALSKCRECDSTVVFHGAECEECSLACHKKCLETLAIQCGHKKLQGRLQLFGISFTQASKNSADGIPFIIKKCTSEIESRALGIKGIYRVNGAKSRVEKLCQAFENGKDLVELSELSPHDISNVLKLYLRQLPEPLILYRYYNDFIGLAKEYQRVVVEEADGLQSGAKSGQEGDAKKSSVDLNRVVLRIRDLLRQLPAANYHTLHFLVAHLNRVAEQAEENKMTASNLGIIFGPTLVKPRQPDAEVSLSSLVDYPYQALMVELLVRHLAVVFDGSDVAGAAAVVGRTSPRLTPQEKLQRLNRHSASLTDIKESAKPYKRFSSVIPSSHILDEVQEVQPGTDRTESSGGVNGVDKGSDLRRSGLTSGHAACAGSQSSSSSLVSKVQLRANRTRLASRPISMPLERLATPAECADPAPEPVAETPEAKRPAVPAASSRVSACYITPFIDTRALQRRTWDRKYKHYDVTPRTAMIVAKLPAAGATAATPAAAPTPAGTVFPNSPFAVSVKPAWTFKRDDSSANSPLTLRPPRTLQPPPGTFYKPPISRARTLPDWTTTTTTASATTPAASPSPPPARLQTQDSIDSAIDPGASSLSPPQSPPPSSPDDLSPGETKALYHRLRPRRLQEVEHREAHFV